MSTFRGRSFTITCRDRTNLNKEQLSYQKYMFFDRERLVERFVTKHLNKIVENGQLMKKMSDHFGKFQENLKEKTPWS